MTTDGARLKSEGLIGEIVCAPKMWRFNAIANLLFEWLAVERLNPLNLKEFLGSTFSRPEPPLPQKDPREGYHGHFLETPH